MADSTCPSPASGNSNDVAQHIIVPTAKSDKGSDSYENSDSLPIQYHYLTFETTLPSPTQFPTSNLEGIHNVQHPDLSCFASPYTWPAFHKAIVILVSCITSMFVCYAAGSSDAAAKDIMSTWNVNQTAVDLCITTFTIGFAAAPMFLAPFSEINGRKPVFVFTGTVFFIGQLVCALTPSYAGLLIARLLVGIGGSTFSSTIGGVIGDIYHKEDRNTPMSLFAGSALFGTGLGPVVSGFVVTHLHWRWVFWLQVIWCGLCVIAVITLFRETRSSVIISRKAHALNKWYEAREKAGLVGFDMPVGDDDSKVRSQRIRWKVMSDEERESIVKMIGISLYRPFHLLLTEPVVFFFSLWAAFAWAVLYLTFSMIPLVFTTNHNFDVEANGYVFGAMCIGSLLSTIIGISQEKIALRLGKMPETPEGRLYFSCVQSALVPIGLFWFGWTLAPSIHWIVPTIAIGCLTMGLYSVYLAVFNYLVDIYHSYASSALAAQSFCRNMLASIFPLFARAMYKKMTFSGASSFLGALGLLLTLIPWVLVFYGPKIRARSKITCVLL